MYDWSTGLVYRNGRYFDPNLGIWLALMPLVVLQGWTGRKKKRKGAHPWMLLLCLGLFSMGSLAGCGNSDPFVSPLTSPLCVPEVVGGGEPVSECGTDCKGLVNSMRFSNIYAPADKLVFDVTKQGGDIKPWPSESNDEAIVFGTYAAFAFYDEGGKSLEYKEVDDNCMLIQLVEGYRFLTNPDKYLDFCSTLTRKYS